MKISALIAILILSLLPARANLGDSVQDVIKRYGHPTGYADASAKMPFGNILFRAGGYELVLFILDNKEVGARVSKLDKSAFSDSEMQGIMESDTAGSTWLPVKSADPTCLQWTREDKATAMYDKDKHMLMFTSDEMAKALNGTK